MERPKADNLKKYGRKGREITTQKKQWTLKDFFYMTSLHGFNFFPNRDFNFFDCIVWSIVIVSSLSICGSLLALQVKGISRSFSLHICSIWVGTRHQHYQPW